MAKFPLEKEGENMEYLYVAVPKDIDEYEKKNYMGITVRQLKWVIVASIVSVFVYSLCAMIGLHDFGFVVCFLCGLCVFAIGGFKKWHGRPYSEFVKSVIRYYRTNQKLFFHKNIEYLKGGQQDDQKKKTREDRKINKQYCNEHGEWNE